MNIYKFNGGEEIFQWRIALSKTQRTSEVRSQYPMSIRKKDCSTLCQPDVRQKSVEMWWYQLQQLRKRSPPSLLRSLSSWITYISPKWTRGENERFYDPCSWDWREFYRAIKKKSKRASLNILIRIYGWEFQESYQRYLWKEKFWSSQGKISSWVLLEPAIKEVL